MAVLEAVRGWAALKPSEESKETESTTQENTESTESQPPVKDDVWTDERILELKNTDVLSALLDHERHISGASAEDFSTLCMFTSCLLRRAY
jgi:hypothetical protein